EAVQTVSMMAVAKYTAVHFAAFGMLGAGVSYLTHQAEIRSHHPALVIGGGFGVLEAAFRLPAPLAVPGGLSRRRGRPLAGSGTGIAMFLAFTHRPDVWLRVRRALHLARPAGA